MDHLRVPWWLVRCSLYSLLGAAIIAIIRTDAAEQSVDTILGSFAWSDTSRPSASEMSGLFFDSPDGGGAFRLGNPPSISGLWIVLVAAILLLTHVATSFLVSCAYHSSAFPPIRHHPNARFRQCIRTACTGGVKADWAIAAAAPLAFVMWLLFSRALAPFYQFLLTHQQARSYHAPITNLGPASLLTMWSSLFILYIALIAKSVRGAISNELAIAGSPRRCPMCSYELAPASHCCPECGLDVVNYQRPVIALTRHGAMRRFHGKAPISLVLILILGAWFSFAPLTLPLTIHALPFADRTGSVIFRAERRLKVWLGLAPPIIRFQPPPARSDP